VRSARLRERLRAASHRDQDIADLFVADRQIALPLGVGRIGGGERLGDRDVAPIGFERLFAPPGLEQDVGDADMADRQVALQRSVGRGGGGEPLDDGEALAIGSERLLGTAGCRQCERDLVVAGRQPALPRSHSVLRAIESLGRALKMTIVAEASRPSRSSPICRPRPASASRRVTISPSRSSCTRRVAPNT